MMAKPRWFLMVALLTMMLFTGGCISISLDTGDTTTSDNGKSTTEKSDSKTKDSSSTKSSDSKSDSKTTNNKTENKTSSSKPSTDPKYTAEDRQNYTDADLQAAYDKGYNQGKVDGNKVKGAGEDEAYNDGFDYGYSVGYNDALYVPSTADYNSGYDRGWEEGYSNYDAYYWDFYDVGYSDAWAN